MLDTFELELLVLKHFEQALPRQQLVTLQPTAQPPQQHLVHMYESSTVQGEREQRRGQPSPAMPAVSCTRQKVVRTSASNWQ